MCGVHTSKYILIFGVYFNPSFIGACSAVTCVIRRQLFHVRMARLYISLWNMTYNIAELVMKTKFPTYMHNVVLFRRVSA